MVDSDLEQTFDVIVEARKNSTRKGVATVSPGVIRISVDDSAIFQGNLALYLADVFRGSPGKLEIDLSRVRPVRCLGTRIVYFIPEKGPGVGLAPAGATGQKQAMAQFVQAIESASGKTVVTEDLKHLRLIAVIGAVCIAAALIGALVVRMMRG